MSGENLYGQWRQAYVDLHAAYLGVLRIRHARRGDDPMETARDMVLAEPFTLTDPSGADAVKLWQDLWNGQSAPDEMSRALAAATEAIRAHYDSWGKLAAAYADLFKSDRQTVSFNEFMTSTTASRETLLERAKRLESAWREFQGKTGG